MGWVYTGCMKQLVAILIALTCTLPTAACAAPAPRLVVLGDSIGVGLGASTPDHSYARILATTLHLPLDDRAISGSTIAAQPVPDDLQPGDVVVWLTGYNDMRHGNDPKIYGAALRAAVHAMVDQGATVYLAGCLPLSEAGYAAYGPDWNHGSAALVAAYTAEIQNVPGVRFVRVAYDPQHVVSDLVHPSDAGHQQIAWSFLAAMGRRMALPLVAR